jgi:hypothetical protein
MNMFLLAVMGLMAMAVLWMAGPALKDALLKVTEALPNGATNVVSDPIDTGAVSAQAVQMALVDFLLTAPDLAVGDLGNGATMTYDIITSAAVGMGTPTTLISGAIVQTGADGAGAAAATYQFRLPASAQRYIAFKATNSAGGDASDKSGTMEVLV